MKVISADDNSLHMTIVKSVMRMAIGEGFELYKVANNGLEAVAAFEQAIKEKVQIDLITLDIRMPVMDGLTALAKIRALSPTVKIIMASSEDEKTMKKNSSGKIAEMPVADKVQLISKVKDRVVKGIKKEGKIHSLLEACEELVYDPIECGKYLKPTSSI